MAGSQGCIENPVCPTFNIKCPDFHAKKEKKEQVRIRPLPIGAGRAHACAAHSKCMGSDSPAFLASTLESSITKTNIHPAKSPTMPHARGRGRDCGVGRTLGMSQLQSRHREALVSEPHGGPGTVDTRRLCLALRSMTGCQVQVPALPPNNCVPWGKRFNLSASCVNSTK